MTVFVDQGNYFMRFSVLQRSATSDPGTETSGTLWLQPGPQGAIRRTERCDPAVVGTLSTGTYQQSPTTVLFTFSDHQEEWTLQ